jgi:uncharacterized protein HemY
MDLKRGEKCFVCGKEGTAKEVVPRLDIALAKIHASNRTPQGAIREVLRTEAQVRIFSETIKGEESLEPLPRAVKRLAHGDYLKVLSESKNGELRESILRLI